MKKSIILILILTILLCACGKQNAQPANETPAEPVSEKQETVSDGAAPWPRAEGDGNSAELTEDLNSLEEYYTTHGEKMLNSIVFAMPDNRGKTVWTAPEAGIKAFTVPESFSNAKGGLRAALGLEPDPGKGLTRTDILYIPSSREAYDKLVDDLTEIMKNSDMSDEESIKKVEDAYISYENSIAVLFSVIGVPDNGDDKKARELMLNHYMASQLLSEEESKKQLDEFTFIPAGSADNYNFFLATSPLNRRNAFDGKDASWEEEYETLRKDIPSYIAAFTFTRPLGLTQTQPAGAKLSFETKDLDGEEVNSISLFGGHKATMVNIWNTDCTGCIMEMPALKQMAEEFEKDSGQIIGIVWDAGDPELLESAKDIVNDLNVGYTNLIPTDSIRETLKVQSFPTTVFVNEKGEITGEPVIGTQLPVYMARMRELLEK